MLEKGDLKFRLHGSKLNGEFVLAKMRSRRPGSKGTEWLLIKHRDSAVVPGYDIEQFDSSALTGRTLEEIAADAGSAEWTSSRPAAEKSARAGKNAWLAESIAARDRQQAKVAASGQRPAAAKKSARSAAANKAARPAAAKAKSSLAPKPAAQPVRKAPRKSSARSARKTSV